MRRKGLQIEKTFLVVIVLVAVFLIAFKVFSGGSDEKEYIKYVNGFEEAINNYADKDLAANTDAVSYEYKELKKILIDKGYLKEFKNTKVEVSGEPIVLSKKDYKITFYNYNNTTTMENRFELQFKRDNRTYTCTKKECK